VLYNFGSKFRCDLVNADFLTVSVGQIALATRRCRHLLFSLKLRHLFHAAHVRDLTSCNVLLRADIVFLNLHWSGLIWGLPVSTIVDVDVLSASRFDSCNAFKGWLGCFPWVGVVALSLLEVRSSWDRNSSLAYIWKLLSLHWCIINGHYLLVSLLFASLSALHENLSLLPWGHGRGLDADLLLERSVEKLAAVLHVVLSVRVSLNRPLWMALWPLHHKVWLSIGHKRCILLQCLKRLMSACRWCFGRAAFGLTASVASA